MAKHVILEAYTFTPSTRTIAVIGKNIRREQLLLITNTTTNTVIYNFSDPDLKATSYVNATDAATGQETTTIILNYATTSMAATDKLAIVTEETYQEMLPAEVMRDPVDKLRVSTPQSLIDTDFEYGIQPTKWESLNLLNNRPSAFYDPTQGISSTSRSDLTHPSASGNYSITGMTASTRLVTITMANTAGIVVGMPIFVFGSLDAGNADGWWIIETVNANTNIQFSVTNIPAATLYDATKTYMYIGYFFTGAAIPAATNAITVNGTTASVTTTNAHGLRVGSGIYVVGATGMTGLLNSSWVVQTTPTNNTFTFACTATGTITLLANASIHPRALGYVEHRPFDGGVQFSNVNPVHGYQVIRQTRRQFRYQSGKGIQFSTGSLVKPSVALLNLTSSGATVTVTTKYPHGLLPGAALRITGAVTAAGASDTYNGTGVSGGSTYVITAVTNTTTFTYTASSTPSVATALGFPITVSPNLWYGSSNRVGMFDSQNGFYFEFDGQQIYCVRRSSTTQLTGALAVNTGAATVTGTGTKFSTELKPGDSIVIRGMSYIAQTIQSDTAMTIYPEYRSPTSVINATASKTINTRFVQSAWNIDRCDGTGASLFNLDLTRMQMFYIDYTWYGAGAIRFGFKNTRGEVIYCHRIPNNNVNTEAYMRSGNLPARYETNTLPAYTFLTATLSSGVTASMSVTDTSLFPPIGTIVLTQALGTGAVIEYISYTGKTATTFTGLTRNVVNLAVPSLSLVSAGGSAVATTFTFSSTAPIQVEGYSPQCASTISHWGSSVIMDGRFDDDKSLVFVAGQNRQNRTISNIAQDVTVPLISIRIAPSVDNGLTGILGAREIINRMQLTMRSMSCQTTGTSMVFLVSLRLNGRVSAGTFSPAGGSSLAQVVYHGSGATITGGEDIFAFYTNTPGVTAQDLSSVRDIGTGILGGGTALAVPTTPQNIYPDGPDIITICATNITATAVNSINARISWTEAQA